MSKGRPVYRERVSKRMKGPVVCCGCGQQIKRPMRYFYRQVAYKDPKEKAIEWADEYLHFSCRWLIYSAWDGKGQEPCLSPWIPHLVRAIGEPALREMGPSLKKTHFKLGEEEEVPGFSSLDADDQKRLLKWLKGIKFRKPERIRRLWINKQMYPFAAEPPWTAKEWLRIYAPKLLDGSDDGQGEWTDSEEGQGGDAVDGSPCAAGLERGRDGEQEPSIASCQP